MDDPLSVIDLTDTADNSNFVRREQLTDADRLAREEAARRLQARQQANDRMLRNTLAAQQAESNNAASSTNKGIGAMQCVICMDNFKDITATHCGHLFCHACINEHLITAEMSGPSRGPLCPYCRTPVYRKPFRAKDRDKTIVPLAFKVKKADPSPPTSISSLSSSSMDFKPILNATGAASGGSQGQGNASFKGKMREVEMPD